MEQPRKTEKEKERERERERESRWGQSGPSFDCLCGRKCLTGDHNLESHLSVFMHLHFFQKGSCDSNRANFMDIVNGARNKIVKNDFFLLILLLILSINRRFKKNHFWNRAQHYLFSQNKLASPEPAGLSIFL